MNSVPDTFPGLFWAYLVVWVLLGGYILYLGVKLSRLEEKISQFKKSNEP